ncbi:MAG: S26 family signal peptidase [Pirellulales bacterium]
MTKTDKKPANDATAADGAHHVDGLRETIESVVIALILAFLFRTFEAEAFVIPTGSMGPTLMGLHKDVDCPECGFRYQAGVSFEVDDINVRRKTFEGGPLIGQNILAQTCTCPNCRYTASVNPDRDGPLKLTDHTLSYAGDRIWVSKASYAVSQPKRWDVAVFKWPLGADQNYIKRLVGLPGESVRIFRGDLYTMPLPADDAPETELSMSEFTIARKPPKKVLATLQPVYDNDYVLPQLLKLGWPRRWQPLAADPVQATHHWQPQDEDRALAIDGQLDEAWLAYQHIVPSFEDWRRFAAGERLPNDFQPRPQLITDFCAYNTATNQATAPTPDPQSLGLHWVPDLAVDCEAEIRGDTGALTLAIIEGGRQLSCRIDVATGIAQLAIEGLSDFAPQATTSVKGKGTYRLRFSNVDDQLLLWVDDEPIAFGAATAFSLDPVAASEPFDSAALAGGERFIEPNAVVPTADDLAPVRIASHRLPMTVRHLNVRRDVYYIANPGGQNVSCDYVNSPLDRQSSLEVAQFFSDPARWTKMRRLFFRDFPLYEDQFLMLGDNSPSSSDSRYWEDRAGNPRYYVSRELLIGKAFFVYWPHGWETHPCFTISLRTRDIGVPFYPNFWDMRAIH